MSKNLKLLSFFEFFLGLNFTSAILIIYFAQVTSSWILATSLFSIALLSSSLFEVPTGLFSDKIGRKKTMVLGAVSLTLAFVFYAIGFNYWILLAGALLEGLSRAWFSGNNDALLYDTLASQKSESDFDHFLGQIRSKQHYALLIGALFGAIIAYWSFSVAIWLTVATQLVNIFISLKVKEPKKYYQASGNVYDHLKESVKLIYHNKLLRKLTFSKSWSYAVGESSFQFRSAYVATLWPVWALGIPQMIAHGLAGLGYQHGAKIVKRFGPFKIIYFSSLYSRVIAIVALLTNNLASPLIMSSTGVFYGATQVAKAKLFHQEYTDKQRATLDSVVSLYGNILFGVFFLGVGLLADVFSPKVALLITQIFFIPSILVNRSMHQKANTTAK